MRNSPEQPGNNQAAEQASGSVASPPVIALPKGGGAIKGMGEKFAANPVTGSGSMSVPIATSSGRSGFGPQLGLSYDSGAGNGVFGFGWNLSIPTITSKTDKGLPRYWEAEASDVFILSGAEDLVPVPIEDNSRTVDGKTYQLQQYRPRIEGLFARIERWRNLDAPQETFWRSISRDNITTWYGKDANSRIADPADPTRIFSWLICESYDDKGNVIVYRYQEDDSSQVDLSQAHERNRTDESRSAQRYLKRIRYGNHVPYFPELQPETPWPTPSGAAELEGGEDWFFEVVFDYGEHDLNSPRPNDEGEWAVRPDPFSAYRAGFEVRTYRLCQRVLMFHHFPDEAAVGRDCLVRSTNFSYRYEEHPTDARNPVYSFLLSATQTGYQRDPEEGYFQKSLPPLEFTYSEPHIDERVWTVDPSSLENLPEGLDGARYQWVDLDGEGLSGILTEQGDRWFYKHNLSPINRVHTNGFEHIEAQFSPVAQVSRKPIADLANGAQFLDLAGDGQLDVVTFRSETPGFYERTHQENWEMFVPFKSLPIVDWANPNLKFIDLNGDGHSDILITEDQCFMWHPSLAEEGFGDATRSPQFTDEEKGPRIIFADGTQSIYVADLSGDGLADIARIRNGEVCYWPNLGYGQFGAKVTMDHAPWFDTSDIFNQRRIALADIDGSGTTDILYLSHEGVQVYFNQSGNSWSAKQVLRNFPAIDSLASVTVIDLLGNGTACLVWSSSLLGNRHQAMRYIDLMGGQKPHLLIKTVNNLGAETVVQYAPSTKFYLQDKFEGQPWITKLPFPVQVVERTETYDRISRNRFVTRYAYHHGYFDGVEREFRGFGMVEQWDTEEFAALSGSDVFPDADNIDSASHIPPVYTKTWFHTGAYFGREHVSNFFAGLLNDWDKGEYYREPNVTDEQARELLLEDTVLPVGLTIDEEREACRALKGAMLRQEVYALDGTDNAEHPYTVTEQNFTIRKLQQRGDNRSGVFFTYAREVINYHYERNPVDPRIAHALTLAVDDFGNVLQSVAIGYGRRQADETLLQADQARQQQILMTCTENAFTNAVEEGDVYRTPLPSEVITCEVTGLELADAQNRFTFSELQEQIASATEILYHETPDSNTPQKRLLEQARTLYRGDDLSGPLALGALQSLALPFESYQLVFTPEHLEGMFGDRVTEALLSDEGRYVHFEGDSNWWIPSGRMFMSPNENDDALQELAFAQQHFFLPFRFRDPFGQTATVEYDAYDLLMVRTTDSLGNRVMTQNNYRVFAPEQMTDPNGNRSVVAFDVLGMVAGTAVMGKVSEAVGDSLEAFQARLSQAQIDAFFAEPRGPVATELLGTATSRIIYDETRFQRLEQPPFAATIARETHVSDLAAGEDAAIQVSLAYSDGFGRTIQSKVQAEPGAVEVGGESVSPRWTTSGWTIFNNKGKPVKQYEPFFSAGPDFEFGVVVGVSPTRFYDPVGRVVATLHPNHTWEKVVFDPWRQESWDGNDTVLVADPASDPDVGGYFERLDEADYLPTWHQARIEGGLGSPERDAAQKAAAHADTSAVVHFDSLGRPFLSIADNGPDGQYLTLTEQDMEGNPLRVIDARGNVVMAYLVEGDGESPMLGYDVAGRQLYENSMDAGERRVLPDIGGKPIRSWDSRGHILRSTYDELQRPVHLFVSREGEPDLLAEKTVYGEGHPEAESRDLRGQVYQVYDGAGVVTSQRFDFKGNVLEGSRQLAREYRTTVDWSVLANLTGTGAIETAAAPLLDAEIFTTRTEYDALNRPVAITTPDNSVTVPTYNEANLLEQIAVQLRGENPATLFVENIDYNARGQREQITYVTTDGTNFTTRYDYDPDTLRLIRLRTIRHRDSSNLQDLNYAYDPVGNITAIQDNAHQTVFFSNTQVVPHNDYTYDALYRLIRAEGREHAAQINLQPDGTDFTSVIGIPFPNSPEALQRYVEDYTYDGAGNILSMQHTGGSFLRWHRRYQYAEDSNRLLATSRPGDAENQFSAPYSDDAHGNMTTMPHLPLMQWDFKDQLQASSRQVVNEGTPEITYYTYDVAGQRLRKVTQRQADAGEAPRRMKERIYLGGVEIYREYGGDGEAVTLERETLYVMDDKQRIALVETKKIDPANSSNSPLLAPIIRYQLGNHVDSVSLEVNAAGEVISYEEYHSYGSMAYRSGNSAAEVSLKRYGYAGREREEETGLNYFGARYYSSWLGKWLSVDPKKEKYFPLSPFAYTANNPLSFREINGRDFEAVVNQEDKTINIEARFYTYEENKAYLEAAAKIWNEASGNFYLRTGNEETGYDFYRINFKIDIRVVNKTDQGEDKDFSIVNQDSGGNIVVRRSENAKDDTGRPIFGDINNQNTQILAINTREHYPDDVTKSLPDQIYIRESTIGNSDLDLVLAHEMGHSLDQTIENNGHTSGLMDKRVHGNVNEDFAKKVVAKVVNNILRAANLIPAQDSDFAGRPAKGRSFDDGVVVTKSKAKWGIRKYYKKKIVRKRKEFWKNFFSAKKRKQAYQELKKIKNKKREELRSLN
ncbi:MAG: SpvB/TcaC N-terminal domain-containing protein [Cyanobacteria bacterium J06634_5]